MADTRSRDPMLTPDWPQVDSVRVMRMNLPEWPYILLGLLGSIVMGGAMPVYAILFGEVIHPHIYISTHLHIYISTYLPSYLPTYQYNTGAGRAEAAA